MILEFSAFRFKVWLKRPWKEKVTTVREIKVLVGATSMHYIMKAFLILDSSAFRLANFKLNKNRNIYTETQEEIWLSDSKDFQIGRDLHIYNEAFDFAKLELTFDILRKNKLDAPNMMIDIGAHIGTICIPATKRGLVQKAIAVEPDPRNFELLKVNVFLNGLNDQIQCLNIALGDGSQNKLNFEISKNRQGDHRVHMNNEKGQYGEENREVIEVNALALDDLLDNPNNEVLVWIDTQGYEAFILAGAENFLSLTPPIVIEFWPYAMKRMQTFSKLVGIISSSRYSHFYDLSNFKMTPSVANMENLEMLYHELTEDGRYTDLLFVCQN